MREVTADAGLVASCGLFCGACGAYLKGKCEGCVKSEQRSWCKVRACCQDKAIATCAECDDFTDPADCGKFNNLISKIFGLIFRSDRPACIREIRNTGLAAYAVKMAGLKLQSLKK
jgi:hypothetical protein